MAWLTRDGSQLYPYKLEGGVLVALDGSPDTVSSPTPGEAVTVTITATGDVFEPRVALAQGATTTLSWRVNNVVVGSGTTPTIVFDSVAPRNVELWASNPSDILVLNFGFDNTEDQGRYGPGPTYNQSPTPISAIVDLYRLPNLWAFCAAHSGLSGHVDFSGLANLEYIECFQADIATVDLTGCDSLLRLCLEQNDITYLDLNPVAGTLRDLRCAASSGGTVPLTFADQTEDLVALYHYCIQNSVTVNTIPHARMPVIEERWDWSTNTSSIDAPISPLLRGYNTYGNPYDQASVDLILASLDSLGATNGYLYLNREWGPATPSAPSTAGGTSKANLESKGWAVFTQ